MKTQRHAAKYTSSLAPHKYFHHVSRKDCHFPTVPPLNAYMLPVFHHRPSRLHLHLMHVQNPPASYHLFPMTNPTHPHTLMCNPMPHPSCQPFCQRLSHIAPRISLSHTHTHAHITTLLPSLSTFYPRNPGQH